jgi:hypothetical protein
MFTIAAESLLSVEVSGISPMPFVLLGILGLAFMAALWAADEITWRVKEHRRAIRTGHPQT